MFSIDETMKYNEKSYILTENEIKNQSSYINPLLRFISTRHPINHQWDTDSLHPLKDLRFGVEYSLETEIKVCKTKENGLELFRILRLELKPKQNVFGGYTKR